jgi:hypothetical protein
MDGQQPQGCKIAIPGSAHRHTHTTRTQTRPSLAAEAQRVGCRRRYAGLHRGGRVGNHMVKRGACVETSAR